MAVTSKGKVTDDKERLAKENPELSNSYHNFLKDWKQYTKNHPAPRKKRNMRSATFGTIFKREL